MNEIYNDHLIRIEVEQSEIPWLKIFTQASHKEMTECDVQTKQHIWALLDLIETEMLAYFIPDKINIASFANYVPHVHWHIMARFKNDSYFPECMWGKKQREGNAQYPSIEGFITQLTPKLDQLNA